MGYLVKETFHTYFSGDLTDVVIYSKTFSDKKDAVGKFEHLKKRTDLQSWDELRGKVKVVEFEPITKEGLKDGYFSLAKPLENEIYYEYTRTLGVTYGFNYETVDLEIFETNGETEELLSRNIQPIK